MSWSSTTGARVAIGTSLSGRLRNTSLPKSHGLLPLFEAVVNSIQSIDSARADIGTGLIVIEIVREPGGLFDLLPGRGPAPLLPIVDFIIRDNGAGFHEDNMESFQTLDSEYKADQGCRGVGRLLWLKAFDRVRVESSFHSADGQIRSRKFQFTGRDGISEEEVGAASGDAYAQVTLSGFKSAYQKASPKGGETIARGLLEHCLWYFVRDGGAPDIVVKDGGEVYDLNRKYDEYMRSSAKTARLAVKSVPFDLIHLELKTGAIASPHLNWCAANRVVLEENLRENCGLARIPEG